MRIIALCLTLLSLNMPWASAETADGDIKPDFTNSLGMDFKLIPAGEFLMGSGRSPVELTRLYRKWDAKPNTFYRTIPQHQVRVTKSYYLGMYEVTVGQFRQFVAAADYRTEARATARA